jgi:hypothetical protein
MMGTTRMIQFGLSRLSCAMEARDITGSKAFVSNDFEMVFPGARRPESLADLAHNSRRRFRHVTKAIEGFDVALGDGQAFVYCYGALYGEWPDGRAWYIDWFTLVDGKITSQRVWNDSAERRISEA